MPEIRNHQLKGQRSKNLMDWSYKCTELPRNRQGDAILLMHTLTFYHYFYYFYDGTMIATEFITGSTILFLRYKVMILRDEDSIRKGQVTGKTVGIYALLWFLGVPGLLLLVLFLFGVGH